MLGLCHDHDILSAQAREQMAWTIGSIFQIDLKSSLFTSSLFPWKQRKWYILDHMAPPMVEIKILRVKDMRAGRQRTEDIRSFKAHIGWRWHRRQENICVVGGINEHDGNRWFITFLFSAMSPVFQMIIGLIWRRLSHIASSHPSFSPSVVCFLFPFPIYDVCF